MTPALADTEPSGFREQIYRGRDEVVGGGANRRFVEVAGPLPCARADTAPASRRPSSG